MHKFLNAILVIAVLAAGFVLYQLEHATRGLERDIAALQGQITDSQEAIKLLNAEWSSLTRPDRLRRLAEQYLKLETVKALQIVGLGELGQKVPPEPIIKLEAKDQDTIGDILKKMQ
ncbi:MAG: cell division protein FtsL [Rhizobiales bacterium]|nr:cell division protein FtsL [Hyphomicrobiales bacterium]MBI3672879.1 cell division protein FtsL [Hyphomicrobiales bacterium]